MPDVQAQSSAGAATPVRLPEDLVTWASAALHSEVQLFLSPVALALLLSPRDRLVASEPPLDVPWQDRLRFYLAHLANSVIRISSFAVTKWPLLIVVDVAERPGLSSEVAEQLKAELHRLMNDPTWHHGEWALYASPVSLPSGAKDDWKGPRTGLELVQALLGPAVVAPGDLPEFVVVNRADVAEQLRGAGGLAAVLADALLVDEDAQRLFAVNNLGADQLRLRRGPNDGGQP